MEPATVELAVGAATSVATTANLAVDRAVVVQNSNKLAVRLLPCDVLARVAVVGEETAALEVEVAQRLAAERSPVAALAAGIEPRVHECHGFAVSFWTFYEQPTEHEPLPAAYADALQRLHAGMQRVDVATPHFTDRVGEAEQLVASGHDTPGLTESDRELLMDTLRSAQRVIDDRRTGEQLLHGEPHPGNVLTTEDGPIFIDFETCCRGPIEFDVAHVPDEVSTLYPNLDGHLVHDCRRLVLAMVAAWRADERDEFPDGHRALRDILTSLRGGPPWPTLDALTSQGPDARDLG